MIVDTCMHLCSHDVDKYPPCGDSVPYVQDGGPDLTRDASPAHLHRLMQQHGVDRAVNFVNGWYGWDNTLALDLLDGNSHWLGTGALLDPADPASPAVRSVRARAAPASPHADAAHSAGAGATPPGGRGGVRGGWAVGAQGGGGLGRTLPCD